MSLENLVSESTLRQSIIENLQALLSALQADKLNTALEKLDQICKLVVPANNHIVLHGIINDVSNGFKCFQKEFDYFSALADINFPEKMRSFISRRYPANNQAEARGILENNFNNLTQVVKIIFGDSPSAETDQTLLLTQAVESYLEKKLMEYGFEQFISGMQDYKQHLNKELNAFAGVLEIEQGRCIFVDSAIKERDAEVQVKKELFEQQRNTLSQNFILIRDLSKELENIESEIQATQLELSSKSKEKDIQTGNLESIASKVQSLEREKVKIEESYLVKSKEFAEFKNTKMQEISSAFHSSDISSKYNSARQEYEQKSTSLIIVEQELSSLEQVVKTNGDNISSLKGHVRKQTEALEEIERKIEQNNSIIEPLEQKKGVIEKLNSQTIILTRLSELKKITEQADVKCQQARQTLASCSSPSWFNTKTKEQAESEFNESCVEYEDALSQEKEFTALILAIPQNNEEILKNLINLNRATTEIKNKIKRAKTGNWFNFSSKQQNDVELLESEYEKALLSEKEYIQLLRQDLLENSQNLLYTEESIISEACLTSAELELEINQLKQDIVTATADLVRYKDTYATLLPEALKENITLKESEQQLKEKLSTLKQQLVITTSEMQVIQVEKDKAQEKVISARTVLKQLELISSQFDEKYKEVQKVLKILQPNIELNEQDLSEQGYAEQFQQIIGEVKTRHADMMKEKRELDQISEELTTERSSLTAKQDSVTELGKQFALASTRLINLEASQQKILGELEQKKESVPILVAQTREAQTNFATAQKELKTAEANLNKSAQKLKSKFTAIESLESLSANEKFSINAKVATGLSLIDENRSVLSTDRKIWPKVLYWLGWCILVTPLVAYINDYNNSKARGEEFAEQGASLLNGLLCKKGDAPTNNLPRSEPLVA